MDEKRTMYRMIEEEAITHKIAEFAGMIDLR